MSRKRNQLYSIPTYDAAFKWLLGESSTVRPSFLHTFIPDINIQSSERIDDHMEPLKELERLRDLFHSKEAEDSITSLQDSEFTVHVKQSDKIMLNKEATAFLTNVVQHFDDLKIAFPKPSYSGIMDFVCSLDTGEKVLIEMQIVPQDYWDERALAYVAAIYSRQLRKGGDWKKIKRVIGVNILGGGKDQTVHWSDTPDQFVRHYKMTEQLHKEAKIMEGMEIIQYSIMNAPTDLDNQETRDWLTLFQKAQFMTEEEVLSTIKTPAVLQAFERIKYDNLPSEVRKEYEKEDLEYDRISKYTNSERAAGEAKGIAIGEAKGIAIGKEEGIAIGIVAMARKMIKRGLPAEEIAEDTGLTMQEIKKLLTLE